MRHNCPRNPAERAGVTAMRAVMSELDVCGAPLVSVLLATLATMLGSRTQ